MLSITSRMISTEKTLKSSTTSANASVLSYRERIYIIKDIILKLVDYGSLNQTSLISFCGLNLKKHRSILAELELNGLINRSESVLGHRAIAIYKPTYRGIQFCHEIIEPYEKMFPRQRKQQVSLIFQ
jgi:predicted transcriptional regulator